MLDKLLDLASGRLTTISHYKLNMLNDEIKSLKEHNHQLLQEQNRNEPRGKIFSDPAYDWNDPEYKDFKQLLAGDTELDRVKVVELCNGWIKFRELLTHYAVSYMEATGDDETSYGEYLYPKIIGVDIDGFTIEVALMEEREWDVHRQYKYISIPLFYLWDGWKDKFGQLKAERIAKKEEKLRREEEERQKHREQWAREHYENAKRTVAKYEKENDGPG